VTQVNLEHFLNFWPENA